ncbi:MAG TPA: endonuclease domain-containing protein [Devosia sp.]|nr:endonuclease domain-containing protein [Devosia sp.]
MAAELAKKLRQSPTEPERAMWRILHPFRRAGHHFRRQVPLGPYFVDFASLSECLVIEIDGDSHATKVAEVADAERDNYLAARGFKVLRFWNNDVLRNPEGVYHAIAVLLGSS